MTLAGADSIPYVVRVSEALAAWREADRTDRSTAGRPDRDESVPPESDRLRSVYQAIVAEAGAWHEIVLP